MVVTVLVAILVPGMVMMDNFGISILSIIVSKQFFFKGVSMSFQPFIQSCVFVPIYLHSGQKERLILRREG